MALHTADGARKYLTAGEHDAFLRGGKRRSSSADALHDPAIYANATGAEETDIAGAVLRYGARG